MDGKFFLTVFTSVLLAEIGDKTQLATLLFAADEARSKWLVFAAASLALVVAAAVGVFAGALAGRHVPPNVLRTAAGIGFIAIGVWTLWRG
jgi:putative Ca2+/H+ antiporter (TMEM165/GDT1 family)